MHTHPAARRGRLLAELGVELPVLAAPMAGGPGSPELVIAAGRAGSLGFLGAGYKRAEAMAGEIAVVRAAGVPFGVNLFAPNPLPVAPGEFRRYAEELLPEAEALGAQLDGETAPRGRRLLAREARRPARRSAADRQLRLRDPAAAGPRRAAFRRMPARAGRHLTR